jgi:hypothetical protein
MHNPDERFRFPFLETTKLYRMPIEHIVFLRVRKSELCRDDLVLVDEIERNSMGIGG